MRQFSRRTAILAILGLLTACPAMVPAAGGNPPEPTEKSTADPRDGSFEAALGGSTHPKSVAELRRIQERVHQVVKRALPATVGLRVGSSHGSGVVISRDGFVLTAGHVSGKPGQTITVIFQDGRQVKGKTLGANNDIDSGLVKITEKGDWPHVEMATSGSVVPGDWVVATGHPNGYIKGRKPVVRLGRVLTVNDEAIRTDCTLVGGDSGGPLFNLDGRVVGIHSRIGMRITTNFHVPIATYRDTWTRLASAQIWGGSGQEDEDHQPLVGIAGDPKKTPAEIRQVFPGSPAARAGIRVGDVLEKFEGQRVENFNQLAKLLASKKPAQRVTMVVRRGDTTVNVALLLGFRPRSFPGGPADP